MDREQIYLQMAMFTLASINKANRMALDNTNGKTQAFMLENLSKDSRMVKASGVKGRMHKTAIIMRVSTTTIKSKDLVFLLGSQETSIEVATKMTKDMGMVK